MLEIKNLSKVYKGENHSKFYAIKGISFNINKGETLGLIGESGSGKSTIGMIIAGILKATDGEIYYNKEQIKMPYRKNIRGEIQILFQHPELSFNPKLKIIDSIIEPYKLYRDKKNISQIIEDIENLGLKEEYLFRYPHELSGGELQRFSICRALATKPSLVVLDEPTSMLDVITQAEVISILNDYKKRENASYLFITHNSKLSSVFSDREIYIEKGKLINLE